MQEPHEGILVTGTGYVEAPPDVACISLAFTAEEASVAAGREKVAAKMSAVIQTMKELGVADRDLTTQTYQVWRESRKKLFTVTNEVSVTVREVSAAGDVLDAAMAAGANTVSGIRFGIEDRDALERRARERAVADAASKAEALARLAGVEPGAPLWISEQEQSYGGYAAGAPMMMDAEERYSRTPVESGELKISVSVQIRYGIK